MGLDCSHDCWHGSYSSFHAWRLALAEAVGIPLMQMSGYGLPSDQAISWGRYADDPLTILLSHSDSEGEIAAADCALLADRLEELLPKLRGLDGTRADWYSPRGRAEQFIAGLRQAAAQGEAVEFH